LGQLSNAIRFAPPLLEKKTLGLDWCTNGFFKEGRSYTKKTGKKKQAIFLPLRKKRQKN